MKKTRNIILSCLVASTLTPYLNAGDLNITKSISVTNNYVARGTTQSNDKGAVFGEITLDYKGFFAGAWASNVEFEGADADSEIDLYAGYSTSFEALTASLYYTRYLYPHSDDILYYDEATLDLSYTIDKLTLGAAYYLATYTEHDGEKLDYYEGYTSYDFDVVTAHASAGDYEDIGDNYTFGLTKSFDLDEENSLTLDLTYSEFDADNQGGYEDEHNLYATITYTF